MRIIHAGVEKSTPVFSGVKLYIGIPTRTNTCSIEFATSLAASMTSLVVNGAEVHVSKSHNDCFVEVARNHIAKGFLDSNYTHLIMIDDDMGWNPTAIQDMILADKDFIAGAGPMKGDKLSFAAREPVGWEDNKVFEVTHIGGAFMLLKREMLLEMVKAYPDAYSDYYGGYELFKMEVNKERLITEDFYFCENWKKTGGKVWCYSDIDFTHTGVKEFSGNYGKELQKTKAA